MSEDLTQGRLSSVLISFTMPLILSGILQQMYSWADAFIVGNVEGETALGGIGAVNAIGNLFIMIITGLTTGLSVLAARQFGMGRKDDLRAILSTFSIVLTSVFVLVCGLCVPFVSQIVQLLDTPTVLFETARSYLLIVLAGFPFLALYNIFAAVLRGAGDSKAALWAVAVSSLVNVVLDLVLVASFRFGVAGAAFATSLSQMAMAVFMAWYAFSRYPYLRFIKRNPLINREIFIEGMKLSIPPAIQSAIHCGGNLILQRFMNGFGEQTVAAITTAYRVDSVILLPVIQFGSGCSAVTAQNLGGWKRRASEAGTENRCCAQRHPLAVSDRCCAAVWTVADFNVRSGSGLDRNRLRVLFDDIFVLCHLRYGHGLPWISGRQFRYDHCQLDRDHRSAGSYYCLIWTSVVF